MYGKTHSYQLKASARSRLQAAAADGASDKSILELLLHLIPAPWRKRREFARLLFNEYGIPERLARGWLEVPGALQSGRVSEDLADLCWPWLQMRLRGREPVARVSTPDPDCGNQIAALRHDAMARITRPVQRSRPEFQAALLQAYRDAGLAEPRVVWFSGILAAQCFLAACTSSDPCLRTSVLRAQHAANQGDALTASIAQGLEQLGIQNLSGLLDSGFLGLPCADRVLGFQRGLDPVMTTRASAGLQRQLRVESAIPQAIALGLALQTALEDAVRTHFVALGSTRAVVEEGEFWGAHLPETIITQAARLAGVDPEPALLSRQWRMEALAQQGFFSWLGTGAAVCCDGPTVMHTDDEGRLHCDAGPAVKFADGLQLFFIEGQAVREQVVLRPRSLSVAVIRAEENAEVRRIMIERFGHSRYLEGLGAKLVDMDCVDVVPGDAAFGSMPRALMDDSDGGQWLIGTDGSTRRVYYMPVPRFVRTCAEAHDLLAGFDEANIIASS